MDVKLIIIVLCAIGRTSGATYEPVQTQPAGIIDLYGFGSLDAPFLIEPSAYYQSLPAVS